MGFVNDSYLNFLRYDGIISHTEVDGLIDCYKIPNLHLVPINGLFFL